uniref:Uncharacterized protein n=1 Tax=viral metagenome TaxID=1070528 RepID=A0A6M3K761_9ZZZZ
MELTEEYVEIAEARLKYWENESIETNCEENMVQKDQLKLPIGEVSSD